MDRDNHLVTAWRHEVANSRSQLKLDCLQIDDEELVDRRNYHTFTTQGRSLETSNEKGIRETKLIHGHSISLPRRDI